MSLPESIDVWHVLEAESDNDALNEVKQIISKVDDEDNEHYFVSKTRVLVETLE